MANKNKTRNTPKAKPSAKKAPARPAPARGVKDPAPAVVVPVVPTPSVPVVVPVEVKAERPVEDTTLSFAPASLNKPRPEVYQILAGEVKLLSFSEPEPTSKKNRGAKPQWTPARRKAVTEYIATLQNILRLRDWEILVDFDPLPLSDHAYATMAPAPDQHRATIQFSDLFLQQPVDALRQTLVHEMLHCHFHVLQTTTENMIAGMGESAALVAGPAVNTLAELTVDALADAIAPLLPVFELPSR